MRIHTLSCARDSPQQTSVSLSLTHSLRRKSWTFPGGVHRPTPHANPECGQTHHHDVTDTYGETSSSFPKGTREMFPKTVSPWDVRLSSHPCRRRSARKKTKRQKLILQKKNCYRACLHTTCSGEQDTSTATREASQSCSITEDERERGGSGNCGSPPPPAPGGRPPGGNAGISPAHLFQFLPVVVAVPHHHGPQFGRLEELQHFAATHLEEAAGESCVPLANGDLEDVIHISIHKLLPVRRPKKQRM